MPTPTPTPVPTPAFWIPVGPAPLDASGFGVAGGVSGRVWAIAVSTNFDHRGTDAMYIGVNGGGVWRSTDFLKPAPHWTPLTDHFPASFPLDRKVGLQNIGAIAVDPNHPWIIYAGSGDPDLYGGGNAYGHGLLKSTDGGNTWSLLSLGPNSSTPGFARILVDPTDPSGSTVYAAGGLGPNSFLRGIFKSKDGGESWSNIQNSMPAALSITDIDYSVSDNKLTLFAGVNDLTGRATGENGIWQSTNGGQTWFQMFIFPLIDLKGQTPRTNAIGVIKFAIDHTPGTSHGAFAAVGNSATSDLMNIYKLKQGLWVPTGGGMVGTVSTWGALAIGMSGSGGIYVGMGNASQDGIFQSTDGGLTWASIFIGANGIRPHHDQRCWAAFGDLMFEGNDGGINRFTPLPNQRAGPGSWESLNTGSLQTILANGMGLHPQYPNVMLEGSQDNAVGRRTNGAWSYVTGDDDGRTQFDPHDARFAYRTGVSAFDFFFRSDDGGTTWSGGKSVPSGAQSYAPFAFHPANAGRIAMGTDQLYETRDRADHWKAISGQRGGAGNSVTAIAYGGGDIIYAAFGRQLVKTLNDGGDGTDGNWPVLNEGNNWNGKIISIAVDRHAPNRVYLATEDGAIWQSRNSGATWTNITTDFPSPPLAISSLALRSDTAASEPTLFVGTSVGVYSSTGQEENRHWERLGTDLPDVNVTDVRFHDTTKYLAASTYGRGLFAAYLHFRTDVGPGSTSLGNTVFDFAKDLDGRISVNQAEFGQPFSGWFELQGGGLTDVSPAATTVRSSVFVFVKGLDRRLYLNQAEFGHPFSGWFELQGDGRTNSRPSAATIGDTVFVFVTGLDGHIFLNQADFGHAFGNWFEVQGNGVTNTAPAATALNRTVFVFMKGLDGRILLNQADFGHAFGDWFEVQGNGRTDAAPAAATLGNTLFVVIKGLDGRVYLNQAEFGHAFSGWFELQGGLLTDAAPSAVAVGKNLFVFIKGLDGRIYVNQAEFGHAFSGWFEVGGGLR